MRRGADGRAGAAQQGSRRGAGEQQDPCDQSGDAGDRGPGLPEQRREGAGEGSPDPASVLAEREHQAEGGDGDPRAEGAQLDERAPRQHQAAHHHEHERQRVDGLADDRAHPIDDPSADGAAVPAEVDDRRQEEAEGREAEPHQLGVLVVALGALPFRLLDA